MITHYASKIRPDGAVSALCYSQPRAINLNRASWTNRISAVTCAKCREQWLKRDTSPPQHGAEHG